MANSGQRDWISRCRVLVSGCLLVITFGTSYTFGNLNPYITSYMRHTGSAPTLTYTVCSWVYGSQLVTQAFVMPLVGFVERRLGPKVTVLMGCWIFSGGVCLSYFAIQHSFGALIMSYGVIFGLGIGFAYMIPISLAMKWMAKKPGLATGIVNGGAGCGSLIFNMVETSFINPDNKKVQIQVDQERYFDQSDVLERVPSVFLLLGGVYAAMQLVAVLLLPDPPATEYASNRSDDAHNSSDVKSNKTENENDITIPLIGGHKEISSPNTHSRNEKMEDDDTMTPTEVLKSKDFYLLFSIFVCNGLGVVFLNSLYKAFGLSFINDDVFLSLVGTMSSIFNFLGRVFWGSVADFSSFRVAMMIMCSVFTVFVLTLQMTVLTTKYLYMVYVCVLLGTGAGTYSLIPLAMVKRFGKKHITTNYGFMFFSQAITAPLTILISQNLLTKLGWTGLFFVIGALYYAGFILAYLFKTKDKHGREI